MDVKSYYLEPTPPPTPLYSLARVNGEGRSSVHEKEKKQKDKMSWNEQTYYKVLAFTPRWCLSVCGSA